jgi:hypothetical protein
MSPLHFIKVLHFKRFKMKTIGFSVSNAWPKGLHRPANSLVTFTKRQQITNILKYRRLPFLIVMAVIKRSMWINTLNGGPSLYNCIHSYLETMNGNWIAVVLILHLEMGSLGHSYLYTILPLAGTTQCPNFLRWCRSHKLSVNTKSIMLTFFVPIAP